MAHRFLKRLSRQTFRQHRKNEQDDRAEKSNRAEPGMEEKAQAQIERELGQIEQRGRTNSGQEAPNGIEIAQGLQPFGAGAPLERKRHQDAEHAMRQLGIQGRADSGEEALAKKVEHPLQA